MARRRQPAWGICGDGNVSTAVLCRHRFACLRMRQHPIELQHCRPCELAQFAGEEADLFQSCPGAQRSGIRPVAGDDLDRHGPDRQRDHTLAGPAARPAHRHDEPVHGRQQSQCSILDPADDGLSEHRTAGDRRLEPELDHGARQFLQSAEATAQPSINSRRERCRATTRRRISARKRPSGSFCASTPCRPWRSRPDPAATSSTRWRAAGTIIPGRRTPASFTPIRPLPRGRTASCASTISTRPCFTPMSIQA